MTFILFISCGGDDEASTPELGLNGTVTFDGTDYTISNGLFTQSSSDGNTEATFFLANGDITPATGGGVSGSSTFVISIVAVATGSNSLSGGEYATSTNTTSLFASVQLTVVNGGQVSTFPAFVGGTISISGSGSTYTLTFNDVPFGQGRTLSGTVSGTYGSLD